MVATALYLSLKSKYNEEIHLKVEIFLRTYGTSKPTRESCILGKLSNFDLANKICCCTIFLIWETMEHRHDEGTGVIHVTNIVTNKYGWKLNLHSTYKVYTMDMNQSIFYWFV
jgi:hypothetical protein